MRQQYPSEHWKFCEAFVTFWVVTVTFCVTVTFWVMFPVRFDGWPRQPLNRIIADRVATRRTVHFILPY